MALLHIQYIIGPMPSGSPEVLSKLREILSSYSKYEWGLITAGIVMGGFFLLSPAEYNLSEGGRVLSTLASAQASLLAIVFSVSILGVQLIANRYSSRMTTLITSSTSFQGTLLLVFVSVGFDLVLLFNLPQIPPQSAMAGVAIAGGLAAASGITLKRYVDSILDRSTPEGLLRAYDQNLTLENFRESVSKSEESLNQHPLHDLHEVIMSSLSRHEWSTAQNGIRYTEKIAIRIIEEEVASGNYGSVGGQREREHFKLLLTEYLPRTVQHGISMGEEDLAIDAIETIQEIGKCAITNYWSFVSLDATSGLREISRGASDNQEGHKIRHSCLDSTRQILIELLSKPSPSEISAVSSQYTSQIRIFLIRDYDKWAYRDQLSKFYSQGIALGLKQYLEHYGDFLSDSEIEWDSRSPPEGSLQVIRTVFWLRRKAIETTVHIFRYIDRNGEWPILLTSLRDGWLDISKASFSFRADDLTVNLIRCYIDTGYIVFRLDPEKATTWNSALSRFKDVNEADHIVNQAIEESIEIGPTPKYQEFIQELNRRQEPESPAQAFYENVTGNEVNYEDWVTGLKKEVRSASKNQ